MLASPKRIARKPGQRLRMQKKKRDTSLLGQRGFGSFMESELRSGGAVWRYGRWDLWRDFVAWLLAALQDDEETRMGLEARKPDAIATWDRWRTALAEANQAQPCIDHLGSAYMTLGMGSEGFGQYFTPDHVAELMAAVAMQMPVTLESGRLAKGIEPTCGSGVMVLAAERVRRREALPPIIWTLIDLDPVVAQMAAIQCSLNDIPSIVLCGDSLTWGLTESFAKVRLVSPRVRFERDGKLERLELVTESQAGMIQQELERHALQALAGRAVRPAEGVA